MMGCILPRKQKQKQKQKTCASNTRQKRLGLALLGDINEPRFHLMSEAFVVTSRHDYTPDETVGR